MSIPGTNRGARLAGPFIGANYGIDTETARRIQQATQPITKGLRQGRNGVTYVNPVTEYRGGLPSDYMRYVQKKLEPRSPIPGLIVPVTDTEGRTRLPRDAYDPTDPIGAARAALNTVGQRLEQAPADYDKAVFVRAANAITQDDPRLAPYLTEYQQALGDRLTRKDKVILPGDAPVNDRHLSYREEGGEQDHDPTEVFTQNKPGDVFEIDDGEGYEEGEPTVLAIPPERTGPVRGSEEKELLGKYFTVVDNNTLNEEAATKGSQLRPDGGDEHLFPKDKNTTGSGPYNDDITAPSFTFTGAGSGVLKTVKEAMDAGDMRTVNQIFAGYPSKSGGTIPVIRNYTIPAMDPRLRQFVIGVDSDGTHRVRLPSGKELDVPGGLQGEFDPINFWKAVGNQETPIHRVKKTSEVFGANDETGALLVKHPETGELTDFYPVPSLDETGYHNGRLGTKYRYDLDAIQEDLNSVVGALHGIEGPPRRLQSLHEDLSWGGIYGLKRAPSLGTSFLDVTRAEINNLSVPEQTGYGGRARGNPTIASSDRVDQILRERIDMMTNELAQPDLPDTRRTELLAGREQALAAMQPENRDPGKIAARTAAAIAREAAARDAVQAMVLRDMAIKGNDVALAQLPANQQQQIQRLRDVHRQQAAGLPPTTENVLARAEGPDRFLGRRTNDVIEIVDGPTVDPAKLLARRTPSGGGGPSQDFNGLKPGQDPFAPSGERREPGAVVTYPIGRLLELSPEGQARALQTVPRRALSAPGIAKTGDFRDTAIQIALGNRPSQDIDFLRIPAEQLAGAGARPGEPIFVRGAGQAEAPIPYVLEGVTPLPARLVDEQLPAHPLVDMPLDVGSVGSGGRQLQAAQAAARLRAGLGGAELGTRISKPGRTRREIEAAARDLQTRLTPDWAAGAQGPHYSEAALQDALAAARQVLDQST